MFKDMWNKSAAAALVTAGLVGALGLGVSGVVMAQGQGAAADAATGAAARLACLACGAPSASTPRPRWATISE